MARTNKIIKINKTSYLLEVWHLRVQAVTIDSLLKIVEVELELDIPKNPLQDLVQVLLIREECLMMNPMHQCITRHRTLRTLHKFHLKIKLIKLSRGYLHLQINLTLSLYL